MWLYQMLCICSSKLFLTILLQHLMRFLSYRAGVASYNRPVANLLIMGGHFPQIMELFQGLKIGVPSGCPEETSIFKIMIDDVTLWSKLEPTW